MPWAVRHGPWALREDWGQSHQLGAPWRGVREVQGKNTRCEAVVPQKWKSEATRETGTYRAGWGANLESVGVKSA